MIAEKITIPKQNQWIIDLIKPNMEHGPWIAGGAVMQWIQGRSVEDTDVDVFFANQRQMTNYDLMFSEKITKANMGNEGQYNYHAKKFSSDNAVTYMYDKVDFQLIRKRFYRSAEEVIANFDFELCKMVTDGRFVTYAKNAKSDLRNKRLNIAKYQPDIFRRLVKYASYGFVPTKETIDTILNAEDLYVNFKGINEYDTI